MAAFQGVKGLYEKRGWFYFQPPTPKVGLGGGAGSNLGSNLGSSVRPKPVALKTRDLAEAMVRMEEHRAEADLMRSVVAGTLKEILPRYYAAKREDAISTRRTRVIVLEMFMEDTGNPRADRIDAALVEGWRLRLQTRTQQRKGREGRLLSGTTVKSYTIVLRAFVNWLREEKILRHDPMAKLKRQTRVATTRRHEFLTPEERERVMELAKTEEVRLILHLGFFAGMRVGEMLACNPRWIWVNEDWTKGSITVQETPITLIDGSKCVWRPKTRELRTIPMHPRLLAFLKDYGIRTPWLLAPHKEFWPGELKKARRHDAKVALRNLAKRAGVAKLDYHLLRHTFATLLVMRGVALAEVAGLLGDSLRVTEETYAGFSPSRVNPLEGL